MDTTSLALPSLWAGARGEPPRSTPTPCQIASGILADAAAAAAAEGGADPQRGALTAAP